MGYSVNANGNLTARGSDTFLYDHANRLTSATISGTTTSYTYDGDGKRVSSQVGANAATRYLYDINAGLPVLLEDGSRKYVWGLGLAYAVDSSGNVEVYHDDGLGSVRALTDASGAVVQTYETDEFGIPVTAGTHGSKAQPFGYTGEQRDPFAGFVGVPLSLNRFSYVLNNPVMFVDPSGLAGSRVTDQYRSSGNSASQSMVGSSRPPLVGYGDFSLSIGHYGLGGIAGAMVSEEGLYPYLGGGLMTPGATFAATAGPSSPVAGWTGAVTACFGGCGQIGYSFGAGGGWYWEAGVSWPPIVSASATAFYVWGPHGGQVLDRIRDSAWEAKQRIPR